MWRGTATTIGDNAAPLLLWVLWPPAAAAHALLSAGVGGAPAGGRHPSGAGLPPPGMPRRPPLDRWGVGEGSSFPTPPPGRQHPDAQAKQQQQRRYVNNIRQLNNIYMMLCHIILIT